LRVETQKIAHFAAWRNRNAKPFTKYAFTTPQAVPGFTVSLSVISAPKLTAAPVLGAIFSAPGFGLRPL
jgi:hypothetical protein